MADSKERLSSLNSQNEVLHSHIQNLTDQMEAEEAKRHKEDRDVADRVQGEGTCLYFIYNTYEVYIYIYIPIPFSMFALRLQLPCFRVS